MWWIAVAILLVGVSAMMAALGYRGRPQVVGIDLGTTYSVVALKAHGAVTVLPDHWSGSPLVPSVVTYLPNGTIVVGDEAVRMRNDHPVRTIFNAKRFIGRRHAEVLDDAPLFSFQISPNATGGNVTDDAAAGFTIPKLDLSTNDRWVSPTDVGAEVVQHLKRSIAKYTGYPISRAVICVPAKFGEQQTRATQDAFEQAGFKVMRVMEEPTAAAVAYNLHKAGGVRNVLVYDIGGGTLDTSLLYMNGKSLSLLGVAGDDHLGGSDFDLKMLELLQGKFSKWNSTTSRGQRVEEASMLRRCDRNGLHILSEETKIQLSSVESVQVQCLADDGVVRAVVVSRDEFEHACADLYDRAMKPVEKVLADQVMSADNVDDIVLVGGASRTPRLRQLLQDFFGPEKTLHTEIDPDVTVAYGAANILD